MNWESLLPLVKKPGRYIGNEFNMVRKDWSAAELRLALIFPDLYEIGMSHQGLQILYHIINDRDGFLAERCYAPDTDLEQLVKENPWIETEKVVVKPDQLFGKRGKHVVAAHLCRHRSQHGSQ